MAQLRLGAPLLGLLILVAFVSASIVPHDNFECVESFPDGKTVCGTRRSGKDLITLEDVDADTIGARASERDERTAATGWDCVYADGTSELSCGFVVRPPTIPTSSQQTPPPPTPSPSAKSPRYQAPPPLFSDYSPLTPPTTYPPPLPPPPPPPPPPTPPPPPATNPPPPPPPPTPPRTDLSLSQYRPLTIHCDLTSLANIPGVTIPVDGLNALNLTLPGLPTIDSLRPIQPLTPGSLFSPAPSPSPQIYRGTDYEIQSAATVSGLMGQAVTPAKSTQAPSEDDLEDERIERQLKEFEANLRSAKDTVARIEKQHEKLREKIANNRISKQYYQNQNGVNGTQENSRPEPHYGRNGYVPPTQHSTAVDPSGSSRHPGHMEPPFSGDVGTSRNAKDSQSESSGSSAAAISNVKPSPKKKFSGSAVSSKEKTNAIESNEDEEENSPKTYSDMGDFSTPNSEESSDEIRETDEKGEEEKREEEEAAEMKRKEKKRKGEEKIKEQERAKEDDKIKKKNSRKASSRHKTDETA